MPGVKLGVMNCESSSGKLDLVCLLCGGPQGSVLGPMECACICFHLVLILKTP